MIKYRRKIASKYEMYKADRQVVTDLGDQKRLNLQPVLGELINDILILKIP
jgi:hypothetical protein